MFIVVSFNIALCIWLLLTFIGKKVKWPRLYLGTEFKRSVKWKVNLFCILCVGSESTAYCTDMQQSLQHTALICNRVYSILHWYATESTPYCTDMQHSLQHTALICNRVYSILHWYTTEPTAYCTDMQQSLQHTALICKSLQHTALICNVIRSNRRKMFSINILPITIYKFRTRNVKEKLYPTSS